MLIDSLLDFFNRHFVVFIGISVFLVSFLITYLMIPRVIHIANDKSLIMAPLVRSSHYKMIPALGGVPFFASVVMSIVFLQKFDKDEIFINLIAALSILLYLGLKDDLMILSPITKVIFQSFAISLVLVIPEFQISSFHGFLEINEISLWISIPLGYFLILFILNAYNLIDGIDGLAAIQGILIATIYAFLFFIAGEYLFQFIAIIIVGFLLAFLKYNLSKSNKIFMGDTGSMIVGFLLGLLTLRCLSLNSTQLIDTGVSPENTFLVILSILFFPGIDVIRVIFIRLIKGNNPFSADRSHLHHIFIDKGLTHLKASITLSITSLIIFIVIYTANRMLNYFELFIVFFMISFMTFYLLLLLDSDPIAKRHRKILKAYIPKGIYNWEFSLRKKVIVFLKKNIFKGQL